jgi:hypothetical protein
MIRPQHQRDHLSKSEIRKDAVQGAVEAAATTVGEVATILTTAVKDVAGALGGLATEVFELRDAARKAAEEHVEEIDEDPRLEIAEDAEEPELG